MNNIIIITGVAGFIGYSLADKLLNLKSATIIQYTIKGRFMSR